MRAPLSAGTAILLTLITAPTAQAQGDRAGQEDAPKALSPVIVLPVVAGRRADRELAQRFVQGLKEEASAHPEIESVSPRGGPRAARRLQRQTRRCKRRPGCLAKLGRRVKARWVLATTGIEGDDGGLQVLAIVVDARTRKTLRQTSVTLSRDDFDAKLAESFVTLFGVEPAAEVEIDVAAADATSDPEPAEPEPADPPVDATSAAEPLAEDPPVLEVEPTAAEGAEAATETAEAAPEPAPSPGGEVRREEARRARAPAATRRGLEAGASDGGLSTTAWAGLSSLALGAVSAGLGAVWVTRAQGATELDRGSSTQLAARDELDGAQGTMRNGNIALLAGGVLGLTGLTLLVLDSLDDAPAVGVAPVDGGPSISVSFDF